MWSDQCLSLTTLLLSASCVCVCVLDIMRDTPQTWYKSALHFSHLFLSLFMPASDKETACKSHNQVSFFLKPLFCMNNENNGISDKTHEMCVLWNKTAIYFVIMSHLWAKQRLFLKQKLPHILPSCLSLSRSLSSSFPAYLMQEL